MLCRQISGGWKVSYTGRLSGGCWRRYCTSASRTDGRRVWSCNSSATRRPYNTPRFTPTRVRPTPLPWSLTPHSAPVLPRNAASWAQFCMVAEQNNRLGRRARNPAKCRAYSHPLIFLLLIIIILFESDNMAHVKTYIRADRISKKSTIKHSKSHKNADGLAHRSSFTRSLSLLQTYT